MKILSLHIDGFGKLNDLDLSFEDGLNVLYGKMKPENPPFIPLSAECSLELNVSGDVLPKMIPIPALNHGPVQGLIRDGSVWKAREKSSGLNADFKRE